MDDPPDVCNLGRGLDVHGLEDRGCDVDHVVPLVAELFRVVL